MDYGVFIPITNNGWIASKTSPQYMPTFELNKQIVQRAEKHGFEFVLSMIKFRGFGGETEYWDYGLESFTLMAGLAAVTEKIKLYASVATPTINPAVVARMAATIDSIAPGRFGINIVAGWNRTEYLQMDLWPGDEFYEYRYDYASEYATILRELWTKGRSDFKGQFFKLDDCVCKPLPSADIALISAGMSARGRRFSAEHCDYNFTNATDPKAVAEVNRALREAGEKAGREVSTVLLFMVILGETDADAQRKVELYNAGADVEALNAFMGQAALDTKNKGGSAQKLIENAQGGAAGEHNPLWLGPPIVGSPATVAEKLNEITAVGGTSGMVLTFDDFIEGVDVFGSEVMPLLD